MNNQLPTAKAAKSNQCIGAAVGKQKERLTDKIIAKWFEICDDKDPEAAFIEGMASRYEGIVDVKNEVRSTARLVVSDNFI